MACGVMNTKTIALFPQKLAVNCIILKLFCFTDMNPLQHKSYSIFPIDHISLETFYKTNFYRRSIEQISIEILKNFRIEVR